MTRALIVVDVQNDFCEGGSLAVAGGKAVDWRIANCINNSVGGKMFDYFVATKDFHLPEGTNGGHFSERPDFKSTWPAHCVQGSEGSQFAPAMRTVADDLDAIFYKGIGRADYSGFQGMSVPPYPDREGVYLNDWLQERGVTDLTIVGIAADYCVRQTALDAIQFGYNVHIPYDLTVAVGGQDEVQKVCTEIRNLQRVDRRVT